MDTNKNNTEFSHVNTRETVKKHNIRLSKTLGQNFLTSIDIIKRIADAGEIDKEDFIIEIGSGIGNLTVELAARSGKVLAIEIDRHLIPALQENTRNFSNIEIVNEDFLKIHLKEHINCNKFWCQAGHNSNRIKVIANLPYYITTPIIMKLMEEELLPDMLVLMVQKEAADRIVAGPGGKDYGVLSVVVQCFYQVEKVINVPGHCFFPQPDVDSIVLKMKRRVEPVVAQSGREMFLKVVKGAFRHRRKTIINTLKDSGFFLENRSSIKESLRDLRIEESNRAETLSILQFAQLADVISKNSQNI